MSVPTVEVKAVTPTMHQEIIGPAVVVLDLAGGVGLENQLTAPVETAGKATHPPFL